MQFFGYQANAGGEYRFQETSNALENKRRNDASNELMRFQDDLKKIKNGSLAGFDKFLQVKSFLYKSILNLNSHEFRISNHVHLHHIRSGIHVSYF